MMWQVYEKFFFKAFRLHQSFDCGIGSMNSRLYYKMLLTPLRQWRRAVCCYGAVVQLNKKGRPGRLLVSRKTVSVELTYHFTVPLYL